MYQHYKVLKLCICNDTLFLLLDESQRNAHTLQQTDTAFTLKCFAYVKLIHMFTTYLV